MHRIVSAVPFSIKLDQPTAPTYEEEEKNDRTVMEEQLRIIFNHKETHEIAPLDSRLTNWMTSVADFAESILGEGDITALSVVSRHFDSDSSRSRSSMCWAFDIGDSFLVEDEAPARDAREGIQIVDGPKLGEPVSTDGESAYRPGSTTSGGGTSFTTISVDGGCLERRKSAQSEASAESMEPSVVTYVTMIVQALLLQSVWEGMAKLGEAQIKVLEKFRRPNKKAVSSNQELEVPHQGTTSTEGQYMMAGA